MFLRRLVLVFSIVFCGSLAFAAAAVAAGGLGPGKYTFHSTSANAFFGMGKKGGPPAPSFSVNVSQGLNSFKPTHPMGPRIVNDSTMVFITEFDASGTGGYGCSVVPDSAFTVSRDLQSAALHATLSADEVCPGFGSPVGGSKDAVFAGGNGGLALPITVDVTWTASGPVTTFDQSFSLQCLDYNEAGSSKNRSNGADASGSVSTLRGTFTSELANMIATDGRLDIRGVPPSACFGY
ncbi:MAG TPA: hypothetical protein VJP81_09410 [Candidatus Dormibacteraeota bacterium]|nr:hypothetical protein [Candidatus Dormibacteraeota bacterium]